MLDIYRRLRFSARKLHLGVEASALVLEVGSGDSPCPRSDVLFDSTLASFERVGGKTVHDRPLVLGLAEQLPFRDGAFDFVVAFHVLEHSANPVAFLGELQRVARAGYLETPSLWAERVTPLSMHRLEVGLEMADQRERLVLRRKARAVPDPLLATQFQTLIHRRLGLPRLDPEAWVTRYHWKGQIDFRIENPDDAIAWEAPRIPVSERDPRPWPRRLLKHLANRLRIRRQIDLLSMLRCPDCHAVALKRGAEGFIDCPSCGRSYPFSDRLAELFPKADVQTHRTRLSTESR